MNIIDVNQKAVPSKKARRVGRGTGSGRGKTSQRGYNGQGSRSGFSMNPAFEGGQMPLARRIPKRGFNNKTFRDVVIVVNIGDLELFFEANSRVTPEAMQEKNLIKRSFDQIKILGGGQLTKPLDISAHAFSVSAKERVEAAGGKVTVLPGKKAVIKNKMGTRKAAALAKAKKS